MSTLPDRSSPRADVTVGLGVTAAGMGLFLAALRIAAPPGGSDTLGPSAFPVAVSLLLALSGLMLAGRGARAGHRTRHTAVPERTEGPLESSEPPVPWRRLALMTTLFTAYVLFFIPLGYLTATTAYLFATSTLIDRERWRRNLGFAVAFTVVVHVSFTRLLGIELPAGLLG
ncbi:tripartite tricarboxylate transporter TctB family protein [Streptomyces adelaidensis]|uniref:tripartite tricarboxylate transporter TctB family protein n=1 Tax=Streptomyces adelaidensis TaxID=2796465 RepID=UPI0019053FDC|nr:tripartite tricarboxylate transporter TctB family protein [Streptomyces adelaidensis]